MPVARPDAMGRSRRRQPLLAGDRHGPSRGRPGAFASESSPRRATHWLVVSAEVPGPPGGGRAVRPRPHRQPGPGWRSVPVPSSKGPFKWEGGTTAMYVANVPSQGGRATSPPPHLRWRPTSQRQVGGGGPTSAPNVPTSGGNVQRQRGTWYVPRHAGTRTHLTQRVSSRPAPPRDEPLWALRRAPGGGCSPTEHSVSNGL